MILCAHRLVDLGGDGRHLVRGTQHEGVVRVLLGRGVQQLAEEERVLAQPLNLAVERGEPRLWDARRRATGATASFRDAQAALGAAGAVPWSGEADGALSSDRVDGTFHQPPHRLDEHRAHALLHRLLDAAHRLIDGGALLPQLAVPTHPAERVSGACLGCSLLE